jgi:site-specific DNA recombinase
MARKIIRPLAPHEIAKPTGANGHQRPQRVALYVRVSSEEQLEGYSLDAQLRAARAYCVDKGWEIVAEYVEEAKSARYEDLNRRPQFKAMLETADGRSFDVLLVHKLDRFARNLRVTLATLERLDRAGVGFVSLSEQMDFTTPIGKVILATLGAFAQYYSDNLSQETKKGKHERKAQGIHNGPLPFGTIAGPDGVAVIDEQRIVLDAGRETTNLEGLRLAMRLASEGVSDRLVAQALNAVGYRTTGNRGANPFTKDTVAEIVTNRFYWGELPVFEDAGNGTVRNVQVGWMAGKHKAVPGFDEALWARIQAMREQRRHRTGTTTRGRIYALTGLLTCAECSGRIGITGGGKGKPRLECRSRKQGGPCTNRLTFLSVYEEQVSAYLAAFHIPDDFQEQMLAAMRAMTDQKTDPEQERRRLEARLERSRNLYAWGDKPEPDYLRERAEIQRQLDALRETPTVGASIEGYAAVLRDVTAAWELADAEERNALARTLFDDLQVQGAEVVAVKPRAAFAPFFELNYEAWKAENPPAAQQEGSQVGRGGSDGIRTRTCRPGYVPFSTPGLRAPTPPRRRRGATFEVDDVAAAGLPATLRGKARALGVSHETVRQAMKSAGFSTDQETRNARIRDLAVAGESWPAIAAAVGLSASAVRYVCRDLPRRMSGRPARD